MESEQPAVVPEPMLLSHLTEVLDIERRSFPAPWTAQMFTEELENRNARLFVFRAEGRIVGYLCFWEVLDEAHLMNIAVDSDYRTKGVGGAIMSYLEKFCRDHDLAKIFLEVARRNKPARGLYRKFGFTPIGFRKGYYGATHDDAIVMEKRLR